MAFGRFLYSAKIGCKILAMFWSVFQEGIPILIAFLLCFCPFTLFSIISAFFLTLVFLIVIIFLNWFQLQIVQEPFHLFLVDLRLACLSNIELVE